MGGETSPAPISGADAMNVLVFKARPADRSEAISKSIFRYVADGDGVDANIAVQKLLNDHPDQSIAEIVASFALAHRVLFTFERLVLDKLHADGGGGAA